MKPAELNLHPYNNPAYNLSSKFDTASMSNQSKLLVPIEVQQ